MLNINVKRFFKEKTIKCIRYIEHNWYPIVYKQFQIGTQNTLDTRRNNVNISSY